MRPSLRSSVMIFETLSRVLAVPSATSSWVAEMVGRPRASRRARGVSASFSR
jgi:hypothetical protein